MKKYFLLFVVLLSTQMSFSQKKTIDFLFTNLSIVSMDKGILSNNKDIAIKDGKIIAIVDSKKGKFVVAKVIDCKGKFILPSLGDAHVHFPEDEKDLEKYLTLNLINGITKLRSMRGDVKHIEWRKKYNTETSIYPKMYLSAPPINRSQDFTEEQISKYIKDSKAAGFDFIKLLSLKNSTIFTILDKACKENNIKIAGHFPSNPKGIIIKDDTIFNSNLNSIEHLGGLIGEPTTFENRIKLMKDKNVFSCPTLRWYEIAYGQFDLNTIQKQKGIEYMDSKTVAEWVDKTLKYREKMGEKALKEELDFYAKEIDERLQVINRLNKEKINLLLSPDSSSKFIIPGFGMMDEIKLYKKAGLSNYDILKAGTINFSKYFNDISTGSIEVGKTADFLIVTENPLEKIETLEKIEGIFYNNNYLDKKKLNDLTTSILSNKN